MKNNIKKIYFGGKFNLKKDETISLVDRLKNDYRAHILGNSKDLTYARKNLKLSKNFEYLGPFYCETASNGDFTSTDCNIVLNTEYDAVKNADVFFALFDQNFSVGTVVELGWALNMNKEIIIFYEEEKSKYDIKSEYWFAIADAIKKSNNVKVYKFKEIKEVIEYVKENFTNEKI